MIMNMTMMTMLTVIDCKDHSNEILAYLTLCAYSVSVGFCQIKSPLCKESGCPRFQPFLTFIDWVRFGPQPPRDEITRGGPLLPES